jgi:guanylate cyclase
VSQSPSFAQRVWVRARGFAAEPGDAPETRVLKMAALIVAGSSCVAGVVWTALYTAVFGWGRISALPLSFVLIVGTALVISHVRRDHRPAVVAQIICILWITAFIQWSIGGVFDSGFVLVWAFLGPIVGLVFFPPRRAALILLVFLGIVTATVVFDDIFAANAQPIDDRIRVVFMGMNVGVAGIVVFGFAAFFMTQAVAERERANALLLNILPAKIAEILKLEPDVIADRYEHASVLFADMVGSTPLFAELSAEEAVDWLNEVFSVFDELVDEYGLEKIRTIGDNYMVAAGVPEPRADHAAAITRFGLEMLSRIEALPPRNGKRMRFRVGINSGPLVGGVIGTRKFQFDVWGDTVNVASRMESHGEVGRVHVSDATRQLLGDEFECEGRGAIEVKGRGTLETWFIASTRAAR